MRLALTRLYPRVHPCILRSMMLYCGLLAAPVFGADNGLALTPPMGWRSWNCYRGDDSAYVALQECMLELAG